MRSKHMKLFTGQFKGMFSLMTRFLIISSLFLTVCSQQPTVAEEGGFEPENVTGDSAKTETKAGASTSPRDGEVETATEEINKDPAKMMSELKENMTKDLSLSTGKDWSDLSAAVLNLAWSNNGNKTEISVLELMVWFEKVGGEDRLYLLRILELMDENMNGLLSKDEFISLYAAPMASPDMAIELLHRVNDYDGNGYISVWEALTQIMTVDGINRDIFDMYQQAAHLNRIKDADMDFVVSLHEFTNYMVWQMNDGIGRHTN